MLFRKNKLRITDYELRITHIIYIAVVLLGISFLSYFFPAVKMVGFFGFGLFCLVLGLWKREYALYLAFLELCLGSFGYLLTFEAGGLNLPLRMLFFVVIMGFWSYDIIIPLLTSPFEYKEGGIRKKSILRISLFGKGGARGIYLGLVIFLLFWLCGVIHGYLRGHLPSNIFFDANSYVYLLLFLPALKYINTKEKFNEFLKVVLTGAGILAGLTWGLFILFTKSQNLGLLEVFYKWIRDFRIGEITSLKNGAYRIFIQSQIYLIVGFFLLIAGYLREKIKFSHFVVLLGLISGAIYISLSRSFWVGLFVGGIILLGLLIFTKFSFKKHKRKFITIAMAIFIGVWSVGLFIPKDASLIGDRFKIGESALNTRIEQLGPLLPAIKNSSAFGYGFGKTLTFRSFDPRVSYVVKSGEYTTYAFEWGYLDILLKLGILGLFAYLWFVWVIVWKLLNKAKKGSMVAVWGLCVLGVLLATHMFTPYLNHPLGIGILIIAGVLTNVKKDDKN